MARLGNHKYIVDLIQEKQQKNDLLFNASEKGHIEVVKELIERGADINAKDKDKRRRDKERQH